MADVSARERDKLRGWVFAFSSRLGDRVRSVTAALIRLPRSWRTIFAGSDHVVGAEALDCGGDSGIR